MDNAEQAEKNPKKVIYQTKKTLHFKTYEEAKAAYDKQPNSDGLRLRIRKREQGFDLLFKQC